MVNGQLKAEMQQKADAFHYQFSHGGKRFAIQTISTGFDLVYDGTQFQVLWQQEKRKNAFTWENKNKRHDPFEVRNFGENVDSVVAPTTREQASAVGPPKNLQNVYRNNMNAGELGSSTGGDDEQRKQAIKDLEKEKKDTYNELKSSFGQQEADELIK